MKLANLWELKVSKNSLKMISGIIVSKAVKYNIPILYNSTSRKADVAYSDHVTC